MKKRNKDRTYKNNHLKVIKTTMRNKNELIDTGRQDSVEINGETSNGYHTFNELYYHRAVLFSVIVNNFSSISWKSKFHHDGTMYDGMFIVGINTPNGQATYHYNIEPYWNIFHCKELTTAPEWDGHTPTQAIERIRSLGYYGT